jgi:hypothetical protein
VTRLLITAALLTITALAGAFGYRFLRAEAASELYRERLEALANEHAQLAQRYNRAVRQTAVTELLVTESSVAVRIRNAEGKIATIPTPFSPDREIYVDYAVKDGRLLIRRVFDDRTPPSRAVVVNPALAELDWPDEDALRVGKAVYRGGLTPGVYAVTVTGSGALALAKTDAPADLELAPLIEPFEELDIDLDERPADITLADVWDRLFKR